MIVETLAIVLGALVAIAPPAFLLGYQLGHAKGANPTNATVYIGRYGWKTDRPRVDVSISSRLGAIGVYDFPADEQGEARASLHGRDLAEIAGLPLCDRRSVTGEGNKP